MAGGAGFAARVLFCAAIAGTTVGCPAEDRKDATERPEDKLSIIAALQAGEFDRLEAWYRPAAGGSPDRLTGFFAFRHSEPRNLEQLTAWVGRKPESFVARLARGVHYRHLGVLSRSHRGFEEMRAYYGLAIDDLSTALRMEPGIEIAYAYLLSMAQHLGNRNEAAEIRRIGLEAVPDAPLIHATYLQALDPANGGGSQAEFEAYLDGLRALHGEDPRFAFIEGYRESSLASQTLQKRSDAGEALYRSVLLPDALRLIERAIEIQPTAYRYSKRADIHDRRGDLELALADVETALGLDPDLPYVAALQLEARAPYLQMQKADLLHRLKRDAQAEAAYDRAIALDPLEPSNLRDRARFHDDMGRRRGEAGDIQGYLDHFEARLRDLQSAETFAGGDFRLQHAIGNHWLSRFAPGPAKRHFKRATELAPESSNAWLGLAGALYAEGDCWAVDALKRYLEVCRADGDCALSHPLPKRIRENMGWCHAVSEPRPENWRRRVLPDWIPVLGRCGARFHEVPAPAALRECFERARAGDSAAQYDLGTIVFHGFLQGLQNFEQGTDWLRRAAEQGHGDALAALGEKYVFGLGVPKNTDAGLRLLETAIGQESPEGYFRLGALLYTGRHIPQNKGRGRELIAKAAEHGHPHAEQALSTLPDG